MRRDPKESLQRNVSEAFKSFISRLDVLYASSGAAAPDDFDERINFWKARCGLPADLAVHLHILRKWRNASEHGNAERWARDGPRDAEAAAARIQDIDAKISTLQAALRG